MDRMEYTSSVATMRVYEKRLLDQAKLDRLIESNNAEDAFKILGETEYGRSMVGVKKVEDFEEVLKKELEHVYKDLYSMAKDKDLIDILALKYDFQNLKLLIKSKLIGKELAKELLSDMGTVPSGDLKSSFDSQDFKFLDPFLADAIKKANEEWERTKDPQKVDIIVDRVYFNKLNEIKEKWSKVEVIKNYVTYEVDRYNLLALLRARKEDKDVRILKDLLVEGGEISIESLSQAFGDSIENIESRFKTFSHNKRIKKGIGEFRETSSFSGLERELDNGLMDIIKPSKRVNFGPEPLFAYLLAKERENKLLRIIMVSKLNNIGSGKIRERLRDLYV